MNYMYWIMNHFISTSMCETTIGLARAIEILIVVLRSPGGSRGGRSS